MMQSPVRVLHCVGSMDRGGAETWLMRVLQYIDHTKYQLDFCCLSGRLGLYAAEIEALGGRVYPCRLSRNLPAFDRQFSQLLTEGRYDIVHSHVHFFSGYLLRRAYQSGIRGRIAHSHNTTDGKLSTPLRRLYRAWMRQWIIRYANRGVAVSAEAGAGLFGSDWGADPRWHTIYCGIALGPFLNASSRSQVRAELGLAPDSLVVGHVGRFDPQKNHSFVIDVAQELVQIHPSSYLLLVGDGALRPSVEEKVVSLGLQKNVIFTGLRQNIPELLSAMDVFIMPSRHEGLPVAGLEAQAVGIPIVFSDAITREACVVPDLVTFLSLSSPPQDWARQVLVSQDRKTDAAKRQIAFEQKGFTIQASTARLAALYQALVGAGND